MRNRVVNAAMLVAALASVVPAHAGLIINATFDGTITSDPNAAPIETAINTAIQMFENTYTNNISVDIYFQEGGGLGESDFYWSSASYSSFYSGLVANEGVNSPAIMGLDANGGDANTNGGNNPEGNSSEIEIKSANARAVGIDIPPACVPTATGAGTANGNVPNNCSYHPGATDAEDGIISLDTAILNPGSPGSSGAYDLIPVVEHEIDEILGLGSAIDNCDQSTGTCGTDDGYGSPQDLYRYTASGARSPITVNCSNPGSAYFQYGSNTGQIIQFNNACNGADWGDWFSSTKPAVQHVQDAYDWGGNPAYSAIEIDAMTSIGYTTPAEPEPGTWGMMLVAALTLGLVRRRRSA